MQEQAAARAERARDLVARMAAVYGPVMGLAQRFAVPEDRKSALVVECQFAGGRLDLHLGLDGGFSVDAYGHDSNAACARKAEEVLRALSGQALVTARRVETSGNRSAPAPASDPERLRWRT